jgi:CheY-like chemotaxis protein
MSIDAARPYADPSAAVVQDSSALRILVVDDNLVDRALYRRMLSEPEMNCTIEELDSAEAALNRLREPPIPDCLLLDHRLPGMTGVDFLRRLSATRGDIPMPVVMLTAVADDILAFRAMQAGASTILAKGALTPRALRAAVNTAIQLEMPRRQRILEAEYEYASVAYTGEAHEPTPARLAQFAIVLEFARFVKVLRRSDPSWVPRALSLR